MKLNLALLSLAFGLATAASDADFDKLKLGLKTLYSTNSRMIPLVVRLVFHDLLLLPQMSNTGCIESDPFLNNPLNNGLRVVVDELHNVLKNQNLSTGIFSAGDLIAFAGKIAVETAYPCVQIPFMYHRGPCAASAPSVVAGNTPPIPFSNSMAAYNDHVKYLGLTHTEFAILVIGGHGIQGAAAHAASSGWAGTFSTFSSGKDFISQTLNNNWTTNMRNTNGEFVTVANRTNVLVRLPSDMAFFPDAVPLSGRLQIGNGIHALPFKDQTAKPIQETLRNFTTQPRITFDQAFADVFTKLLARAGGKTIYRESAEVGFCPEFPGEQPTPSLSLKVVPKSTANMSSSANFAKTNTAKCISCILGIVSVLLFV